MAYNFPNSPSNGDTVTISNVTYTYNSTAGAWKTTAAGALVQESAPSNPSSGNLWFDPSSLETYVYYNDGDSNQWVQTNPGGSAGGITVYSSIDDLPLSGASTGDQAYVSGNNRLYIWNGSGWYNIALINTTPSISGVSSSYALANDGTATTVTITATDPEGIPITYSIASDTSGNIATVSQGTGSNTNVFTITPSTNTANEGTFSLTFRASDGVNIATAVSEFTLLFSVANSNYTTALITSVGANNAVNNSFDDASTNNHTITASGNVTQGTFSPYRHGGYSTYFDGTGDYLISSTNLPAIGTDDFTIEFWYNGGAQPARYPCIIGTLDAFSPTGAFRIMTYNDNANTFMFVFELTEYTFNTENYNDGVWRHFAVTREGTDLKGFVNGVQQGSTLTMGSNLTSRKILVAGQLRDNGTQEGYISDVRVIKGTALYTSNFTPPTERLTAVTNTELLTCHLPYIADGSTNAHSITVNGNTKTEPFSPFDHSGYSASNNGGSMYFDGSGDYLQASASNDWGFGTGAWTIEFWIKTTDTEADVISAFNASTPFAGWSIQISSGLLKAYVSDGSASDGFDTISGTTTVNDDIWHHVAVTSADGSNDISCYVDGTLAGSHSFTSAISSTGQLLRVGADTNSSPLRLLTGYLSDVRIVKGSQVYTSAFTPPTAPLTAITNTSLLLNGTDAGIIDKSQSVKTITLNGDVKSSTTQSKYLTSSMYFDGTGDYITLSDSDAREFGGEDFTIELWVKTTIATQYATLLSRTPTAFGSGMWTIFMNTTASGGQVAVYLGDYSTSSSLITTSGASIRDDSWHHVAVVRNGSSFVCYIDGTSRGTGSWAGSITNIAGDIRIGADQNYGRNWEGYMSDLRITKGLARYTSSFTPPTAALQG